MSIWNGKVVEFNYTNYRGVNELRRVVPRGTFYGTTEHHPGKKQWFLRGWCLERQAQRMFAFADISDWSEAEDQSLPWR